MKGHRFEIFPSFEAFGFPKQAVISEYQPMTCVLRAWSEFLWVFFEHFLVCLYLPFQNLPLAALHTALWLLRKNRADSPHGQFWKENKCCQTLHWGGSYFDLSRILDFLHSWCSTECPFATINCRSLIPLAFFSGTQEYPVSVNESWRIHFDFSRIDNAWVPFLSKSMSLKMDMMVIRSLKLSGLMRCPSKSFWIFWRSSEAVVLGKSPTRMQSALHCNSLKGWNICKVDTCPFHLLTASSGSSVFHMHSTGSEYT